MEDTSQQFHIRIFHLAVAKDVSIVHYEHLEKPVGYLVFPDLHKSLRLVNRNLVPASGPSSDSFLAQSCVNRHAYVLKG